ncbi:hypothetical protein CEUSTIGMA_g1439.t1 [Chlamydomonas eustigma]|uniref:Large ribosomal subunit protein mL54 n=1 Tax=Chlamydomonas eustigma TaxID=1157962 RepID=A0A250WTD3_9CHLO|nr:hypothetical protein CEUSTIGMA_g1439.t1 [Chlamydomonas eustigma]|eukprot:GAX73989.1 hypothetical protein CEUSTIGMA_g1439.t1 [Chlamydomonas eustigma]
MIKRILLNLPVREAATSFLPLRSPLPPGGSKAKSGRDKGPKRTGELSNEVATGCALMKGESDPPLKPDSEYPDWLWKLLDPAPTASELQKKYERTGSQEGLTIQELQRLYRLKNKQAINEANDSTKK